MSWCTLVPIISDRSLTYMITTVLSKIIRLEYESVNCDGPDVHFSYISRATGKQTLRVMLKIMKPKCEKMVMKHEKLTHTLMPQLHFF